MKQMLYARQIQVVGQPPSGGCVLKQLNQRRTTVADNQPPSGGCVLKHQLNRFLCELVHPAAFRRLCVETVSGGIFYPQQCQPPSGGCVLKHHKLCRSPAVLSQPPSGGCVLKPQYGYGCGRAIRPAAFRRLCVETTQSKHAPARTCPAAFRRLCVETTETTPRPQVKNPAAFRRLCVETASISASIILATQPPSGGCVLKRRVAQNLIHASAPAAFRRLCVETRES